MHADFLRPFDANAVRQFAELIADKFGAFLVALARGTAYAKVYDRTPVLCNKSEVVIFRLRRIFCPKIMTLLYDLGVVTSELRFGKISHVAIATPRSLQFAMCILDRTKQNPIRTFVGLDSSLKVTSVCILDDFGARVFEGNAATHPAVLARLIQWHARGSAEMARMGWLSVVRSLTSHERKV
jgi:hypothetical protein